MDLTPWASALARMRVLLHALAQTARREKGRIKNCEKEKNCGIFSRLRVEFVVDKYNHQSVWSLVCQAHVNLQERGES
jgi:hypothetical protein